MKDSDRIRALMGLPLEDSLSLDERKSIRKLRAMFAGKVEPFDPGSSTPPKSWFPTTVTYPDRLVAEGMIPGAGEEYARIQLHKMLTGKPPAPSPQKAPDSSRTVTPDDLAAELGLSRDGPSRPTLPAASSPGGRLRAMFSDLSPEVRAKLTAQLQGLIKPGKAPAPAAIHGQRSQTGPVGKYPDVLLADGRPADKVRRNINGFAVPED